MLVGLGRGSKAMLIMGSGLVHSNMSEEYSLRDQVFREFLRDPKLGPAEMTEKIHAKYNSVKAAYAKLAEDGLLQRTGRGSYEPNVPGVLLYLLDRVEKLEKGER